MSYAGPYRVYHDGGRLRAHSEAPSHDMVLERVHKNLYNTVGEAVDEIPPEDEEKWTKSEITKRIVGYIYKASKAPELVELQWQEMATNLVASAMHSYMAACAEKTWFYQLSLGHAFTSAVWELLQMSRSRNRANFRDVQDFVTQEFESHLDKSLLTKAMWDAVGATWKGSNDEKTKGKVYKAISGSYYSVLDELLEDSRPLEEQMKVERFTKRWIESSMQRAWCAVEDAETNLSPAKVIRLFQTLVAPFGEEHEYSCIPIMFIERIGRPPRSWGFLKMTVEQLFQTWRQESANPAPPSKRRKKAASAWASEGDALGDTLGDSAGAEVTEAAKVETDPPEAEEVDGLGVKEEAVEAGEAADGERHPECTSQEDCIGSPSDNLVRHMLGDEPGDLYCQACWESFLQQNPALVGMWWDGYNAGNMYGPL
eukprot:TRINITY_DN11765_c0_g2_i1.p1 TRINITY_DN11765_c0_g2~~TRINITY_DN11765_c0_g2_i1.p1  ORF type:complete len:427 (-),score=70.70 TRINITY_DN11765_c0_g2_i1:57-1337(-)